MTKIGRPSKYDPAFCEAVLEYMGQGFSKTATAGMFGVCKATFDNWCKEHPEFLGAVKVGEALRTLKLEGDLMEAPDGPTVTSRIFALKNAAPDEWRDRKTHEHSGPNGGPMQTEDVSARDIISSRLARLAPEGSEEGDT